MSLPDAAPHDVEPNPLIDKLSLRWRRLKDELTPHVFPRWGVSAFLLVLYCLRAVWLGGFYIVTYALAIYLLNLVIGFLSPKVDPAGELLGDEADEDGPILPRRDDEEFRPFVRRLPEFKFWYKGTRSLIFSHIAMFFPFLDIPVYWPILLVYFIVLFTATMRRQIQHMIQYKQVDVFVFTLVQICSVYKHGEEAI